MRGILILMCLIAVGCDTKITAPTDTTVTEPVAVEAVAAPTPPEPEGCLVHANSRVHFGIDATYGGVTCLKNWYEGSVGGTWGGQPGGEVVLRFDTAVSEPLKVALTFEPLVGGSLKAQTVTLKVNGRLVYEDKIDAISTASFTVEPSDFANNTLRIAVDTPDATSPKDIGLSDDTRKLGVLILMAELGTVSP